MCETDHAPNHLGRYRPGYAPNGCMQIRTSSRACEAASCPWGSSRALSRREKSVCSIACIVAGCCRPDSVGSPLEKHMT